MALDLTPKKFLCRYELRLGATVYGILMIFVMLACVIAAVVDMLTFKPCEDSESVKRSAFAFSIIIIIYSVLMICVHLWFLWATKRGKASVVLVWVAMNGLWLIQTTLLLVVLLCLYIAEANFLSWIMCLVFGIVAFVICLYGVLIGYGLWIEMKARQRQVPPINA